MSCRFPGVQTVTRSTTALRRAFWRCSPLLSVLFLTVLVSEYSLAQRGGGDGVSPRTASELGMLRGTGDPGADNGLGIGAIASDVNLFTGDASASLSLATLRGRSGFGATVDLVYTSNVKNEVRLPNYMRQTSWVGLGFQCRFSSIRADHNMTAQLDDDQYYLVDQTGTSTKLVYIHNGGNPHYLTEGKHSYLKIKPVINTVRVDTAIVSGERPPPNTLDTLVYYRDHIIGWEAVGSAGIVNYYGDFTDTSSRNATWYTVSYNNTITTGSEQHTPYPFAWELAKVKYPGVPDSSYIVYARDEIALNGSFYTRHLSPQYIYASDGSYIEIATGNRDATEYGVRFPNLTAPTYEVTYLDHIKVFNPDGYLLSRVDFLYDFIGSEYFKKRLVDSLVFATGSGEILQILDFDYVTVDHADSNYGAIRRVWQMNGTETLIEYDRQSLRYAKQDTAATYRLVQFNNSECWQGTDPYSRDVISSVSYSEDVFAVMDWHRGDVTENLYAWTWNGRWQEELVYTGTTSSASNHTNRDYRGKDNPFAAGPGTIAYWDAAIDELMVAQFESGRWTGTPAFSWDDASHDDSILVHSGNNYHLVSSWRGNGTPTNEGVFYTVWQDETGTWQSHKIFDDVTEPPSSGVIDYGRIHVLRSMVAVKQQPIATRLAYFNGSFGWDTSLIESGHYLSINSPACATNSIWGGCKAFDLTYHWEHRDVASPDTPNGTLERWAWAVTEGMRLQFTAGQDYVAYWDGSAGSHDLGYRRWDGEEWINECSCGYGTDRMKLLIGGPDYVCVLHASYKELQGYDRLSILYFDGTHLTTAQTYHLPELLVSDSYGSYPRELLPGVAATSDAIFVYAPRSHLVLGIIRHEGFSFGTTFHYLYNGVEGDPFPLFEGASGRTAVFTLSSFTDETTDVVAYRHNWQDWSTVTVLEDDNQIWLKPNQAISRTEDCNTNGACCVGNIWYYEREYQTYVTDDYIAVVLEDASNGGAPAYGTHLPDSLRGKVHLFRWSDGSVHGNVEAFVVNARHTTYAGSSDTLTTFYEFADGVTDESGGVARFARSRVYVPAESPKSSGYAETWFFNDLDDDDDPSNDSLPDLDYYENPLIANRNGYLLDGMPYRSAAVGGSGTRLDSSLTAYLVLKPPVFDDPTVFENAYLIRPERQYNYSYGLVDSARTVYNTSNGLPDTRYRYAPDGMTVLASRTEYAFETEPNAAWKDTLIARNLISMPSKTATFVPANDAEIEGDTLSWSQTDGELDDMGRYLPYRVETLRDTATNAVLVTLDDGWTTYNDHTQILESRNAHGVWSASRYHKDSTVAILTTVGSRQGEVHSLDFELWPVPGSTPDSGWQSGPPFVGEWSRTRSFTGKAAVQVVADQYNPLFSGGLLVPTHNFQEDSVYEVTAWVWSNQKNVANLMIYDVTPTTTVFRRSSPANAVNGRWALLRDTVAYRSSTGSDTVTHLLWEVRVAAFSGPEPCTVWVDDIRVQPVLAQVSTAVLEPERGLVVAKLASNCLPGRYVYDEFGSVVEGIGPSGRVLSTRWSRLSTRRHGGSYSIDDPNQAGMITYREGNMILNGSFEADTVGWTRALNGDLANWEINQWGTEVDWTDSYYGARAFRRTTNSDPNTASLLAQRNHFYVEPDSSYVTRLHSRWSLNQDGVIILLRFYDSTGAERGSSSDNQDGWNFDSAYRAFAHQLTTGPAWGVGEVTFTAPSYPSFNASTARFAIIVDEGVLVDDILIAPDRGAGDQYTSVSITYSDPLGHELQTRTKYVDPETAEERSIVTFKEYDYRGRITKTYKPYDDLWNQKTVRGYEPLAILQGEVQEYHNSDGPGPNCGGSPYRETVYSDDPRGLVEEQASPGSDWEIGSGHTISYQYDSGSGYLRTAVFNEDGHFTKDYRDTWGRSVIRHVQTGSTSWTTSSTEYDLLGNILFSTDPKGYVDTTEYNALGQTLKSRIPDHSGFTEYAYDKSGNLRFVMDPRQTAGNYFFYYKYDLLGGMIEEGRCDNPSVYMTQARADSIDFPSASQGHPITKTYEYVYDQFDTSFPPELVPGNRGMLQKSIGYKSDGTSESNHREYDYDHRGNLIESRIWIDGFDDPKTVQYEYNAIGALVRTIYPDETTVVEYDADPANGGATVLEKDAGRLLASSLPNPDGSLKQLELGEWPTDTAVSTMDYSYNPRGWLVQINDTATNPRFAHYLKYTASGDSGYANSHYTGLIVATDSYWPEPAGGVFDSASCNYAYDYRGWLVESRVMGALLSDTTEYWSYDDNGNITYASSWQYAITTNTNKLSAVYDTASQSLVHNYFYDQVGNDTLRDYSITDTSFVHNYDDRNLVILVRTQVTSGRPDTLLVTYDAEGRRVKREKIWWILTGGGGGMFGPEGGPMAPAGGIGPPPPPPPEWERFTSTVWYIWDGSQVIAEYEDVDSNLIGLHFYLGGMQVAAREGDVGIGPNKGRVYFWHSDHLGQPRYQCDTAGNWRAATAYSAYGRPLMDYRASTGPGLHRGFSNKNTDPDPSGMMDFEARQYDPEIGRFLSMDAAGQFASPYVYVGNSPAIGVDPNGKIAWFVPVMAGAVIGAYTGASIQSGTLNFTNWRSDWWKGAIVGAAVGATLGSMIAADIGASGMFLTTPEGATIMAGSKPLVTPTWGLFSTSISNANTAMLISAFSGQGEPWKASLLGFSLGIWSGTGGLGLAKHGLPGRLAFQAIGSTGRSVGMNCVNNRDPFSRVTLGVGPINLTLGKGQKLLQLGNNIDNIAVNGLGMANAVKLFGKDVFGGSVEFSKEHLSFTYSGGVMDMIGGRYGVGAYAPMVGTDFGRVRHLALHEMSHVWQSRVAGPLFIPFWLAHGYMTTLIGGRNYYEQQADDWVDHY